ncbi:uncharacterized protein PADG_01222 [Paracoccidioides brasiliensis Pb18]|uniref:Leucine-rich repeat-containing protein 40 n=1 Tax=Paracoccidioides brasiliensis (strain Pb18) TaxID=502780 RepID=C1G2Q6_PARBD|nr:uncharacterized protein PADG_01222 [Paracoccidioides brasiliensis Pb18]EEH45072.1 hypothetical protein PADG_01222 [Paracoccidioides brasiliensis Pb18]
MDQSYSTPKRPSGIPRPMSRLPLPTHSTTKSVRPSPSHERLQADPGLNIERLRRPSQELFKKPPLPSPAKSRGTLHDHDHESRSNQTSIYSPTDKPSRPSLSDRTIETIAQIPTSPSPSKKRSTFFAPESPMTHFSCTASTINNRHSRPSSRQDQLSGPVLQNPSTVRTVSAPRTPSSTSSLTQPVLKRSVSLVKDSPSRPSSNGPSIEPNQNKTSKRTSLASKKEPKTTTATQRTSFYGGGKSMAMRHAKGRLSLGTSFADLPSNEGSATKEPIKPFVPKSRKPSSTLSSNVTSPTSSTSKISSRASMTSDSNPSDLATRELDAKKAAKSSSALRESIAKAKAAKKAAREGSVKNGVVDNNMDPVDFGDPFAQWSKTDPNKRVLKNRTSAARTSGHLNIAAMGLRMIPDEVMTMYDFDLESEGEWYESVDLIKFIAADNEFQSLPDSLFPDVDFDTLEMNEDTKGCQFWGLEVLDLHGNLLTTLPNGLRRLQRLRSLNLAHNQLDAEALNIITEIVSLIDLKLANNKLQGSLTPSICSLCKLEVLDLRDNALTELPDTLANLSSLRVINVAENQLTSLPFEALTALPLVEVNAQKNCLQGHLLPSTVTRLNTLQILNVAGNRLESLSPAEHLELPNLQQLSVDANRIKVLPNISTWKSILTLTAEDNALSAIPDGFLELENIKVVDFTGNNITTLDEKISLIDSLISFHIANNPLVERKFLTMDTDDLKRELRNRCEPDVHEAGEENGSVQTEFTLAPESPTPPSAWRVRSGGVLDRSSTDISDLDPADIEPLLSSSTGIKCLYLHHNRFHNLPTAGLSLIAHTLTDLDLSHNPLSSPSFLTAPLTLTSLQNLTLSATGLTSLEPLQAHLSAPLLTLLDVSNNRLTGPLPFIRYSYPQLITFLVPDNQIESLDFDAVQGLQVLDVSNNNISSLPPRLGLLGDTEGSGTGSGSRPGGRGGACLRRLDVAGNSFRVPRWQVVSKGTEAVLEWLKNRITPEELKEWEVDEDEVD